MKDYRTISQCRLCGSSDLTQLFSLGFQYVSDFVEHPNTSGPRVPITLLLCNNCTLVQLEDTAPQTFLYTRHYWYRSGVTRTMREALREIACDIEDLMALNCEDVVLDIGSNDGTLLRSYTRDVTRVGVEPASNLKEEGSRGVDVFINDFWSYDQYRDRVGVPAKVITAIGMFYDLEDPNQFIADIAKALSPDGLFVAQLMCLKNMLDINDLGNLAHEHLEFYSLKSLNYMLSRHELELVDITQNHINGGSYRLYIRPIGGSFRPRVDSKYRIEQAIKYEKGLDDPRIYRDLFRNMEGNKSRVREFVLSEVERGKKIWVYGASTKGNVILQYYGLDHTVIEAAADRSPEKWGRYTVGTHIPIKSEEEARKANPDYFLVLPYSFINEFIARERAWIRAGGKFIVPLPAMRILP